ncbi:MAG: P-II family nitrogen regulator [Candidatus Omnitrophica bacterium]|nr:P-II family nitrogen regulator [Candidatus Omnitrophota bacterium]
MKMIKAVIRPERESEVLSGLEKEGFYSLTKWDVLGRGRQKGVQVGKTTYDELAKLLLMVVVEDVDLKRAIETIETHARTGNFGDGKIFVSDVKEAYTIRTGKSRL